jgi:hypothetical protein
MAASPELFASQSWVPPKSIQAWKKEQEALEKVTTPYDLSDYRQYIAGAIAAGLGAGLIMALANGLPRWSAIAFGLGLVAAFWRLRWLSQERKSFYQSPDRIRLTLLKEEVMSPALRGEMSRSNELWREFCKVRSRDVPMLEGDTEDLRYRYRLFPNDGAPLAGIMVGFMMAMGLLLGSAFYRDPTAGNAGQVKNVQATDGQAPVRQDTPAPGAQP